MKKKRLSILLFLVILLSTMTSSALAEATTTYDLSWWSVDGGGSSIGSGSYLLLGSTGQPDAGILSSDDYVLTGGFWTGILGYLYNFYYSFLPLITR